MKSDTMHAEIQWLFALLKQHPQLRKVQKLLAQKQLDRKLLVKGLSGSSPALLLKALQEESPFIAIADSEDTANYLYSDLLQLGGKNNLYLFPSAFRRHIKYGHPDEAAQVMRTEVITSLTSGEKPLIVTTIAALSEAIPREREVEEHIFTVTRGEQIEVPTFRLYLQQSGFQYTDYVYSPGEVAFRGSIIDIFPFNSEEPYRIDLFDDRIESIRIFSVESQLSLKEVERMMIAPNLGTSEAEHSQSLFHLAGSEYALLFYDYTLSLHELNDIVSSEAVVVEGEGFDSTAAMRRFLLPAECLVTQAKEHLQVHLQQVEGERYSTIAFHILPQPVFRKNFDLFIDTLKQYNDEGYKVFFLTESEKQSDRLADILSEKGYQFLIPTSIPATLHEGFVDEVFRLVFITDHQLFERYHKHTVAAKKVRSAEASLSLKDLKSISVGDFIVHYDHGIGRFAGLFKTKIADHEQEVVKVTYKNDDYLYVSIHNLHKLSKYRSKEDSPPELSQLGGGAWNRLKQRTKDKVKEIARDLMRLYAQRKQSCGFSFSPDSYLQYELEAGFRYEETPDQLKAMEAVKADMESERPMDRLICGDVGFGKTEIAIRAAFKAVCDSKQVAVLVPTTVLAYQHYNTFTKRLKDFPVRVEYLSRAHSTKQAKMILQDLQEGKVDVIIGTHRLVGKDVHFHDLGLLIIDEEQKFGVKVKENLRKLQVNVDTLTMSATPIPRTLQFSLMGTRDLSNILTPPKNRYPIDTSIVRFSEDLLKEAINYELSRNGQIYFIHNRIKDIDLLAKKIQDIVPDARIAVGHGKLPQEDLEQLVVDFSLHEYDILLSTTIVENGIDVPNANTIFIDDADRYGLSDLHQLRGRVGRGNKKAFCYLITPPTELLSTTARRRLRTLETFSDLGSGIRIAMQDLDIRGAGNIFGKEQSGFISDLGFEAYHKIFEEAVNEVKLEEFSDLFDEQQKSSVNKVETLFESDLLLSFPASYVPGDDERIQLYRELDAIDDPSELPDFHKHMIDRFGPLPLESRQLIEVPQLRTLGGVLQLPKITIRKGELRLFLPDDDESPFYQSESFGKILSYATIHSSFSHIEQNRRGTRIVRFDKVGDIFKAIEILKDIEQTPSSML